MAKITTYRQCRLHKQMDGKRTMVQVAWIPSQFATQGRTLKIRDRDGEWINGWKVIDIGSFTKTERETNEATQRHKHQRRASDI